MSDWLHLAVECCSDRSVHTCFDLASGRAEPCNRATWLLAAYALWSVLFVFLGVHMPHGITHIRRRYRMLIAEYPHRHRTFVISVVGAWLVEAPYASLELAVQRSVL